MAPTISNPTRVHRTRVSLRDATVGLVAALEALVVFPETLYRRFPIANSVRDERIYIAPSDSAGVAMSGSPIEFVAMCVNVGPAATTSISPSSLDK